MNETQLKRLFCSSLASGHIRCNNIIPMGAQANLRIVEEAQFRRFDLVINAVMAPGQQAESEQPGCDNILARSRLLEYFARERSCKIEHLRFFPVELKSDDDHIDERLRNQVIDAILTFGLSIVVLDIQHSKRVKSARFDRILPASIICYTGIEDYFEVISVFDRFISGGVFTFDRSRLAQSFGDGNIADSRRAHTRLAAFQRILEKIAFNQLYSENLGLEDEELEFLHAFGQIPVPNEGRIVARLQKETSNRRISDYL